MIIMVILAQNMLIWLILKKTKIKNLKIYFFVNYTFNIHKNGKRIGIQLILKSNSTSFMLNIFFLG